MPLLVVGQIVVVSMFTAKQLTCTQYRVFQRGGSVSDARIRDPTTTQHKSARGTHRNRQDPRRREMTNGLLFLQTAYTPLGWAALLKDPQHRLEAVRPVIERLGGTIVNGWFVFGEYDLLVICDMPDNISAAALSMAISAGGAVKAAKTTPLMTFDDGLEALQGPSKPSTPRRAARSPTSASIEEEPEVSRGRSRRDPPWRGFCRR